MDLFAAALRAPDASLFTSRPVFSALTTVGAATFVKNLRLDIVDCLPASPASLAPTPVRTIPPSVRSFAPPLLNESRLRLAIASTTFLINPLLEDFSESPPCAKYFNRWRNAGFLSLFMKSPVRDPSFTFSGSFLPLGVCAENLLATFGLVA